MAASRVSIRPDVQPSVIIVVPGWRPTSAGSRPLGDRADVKAERHAAVFETLLLRICSLAYPPGTRLSEVALGAEFGLSRTPVREVLQRLALYGLVVPKNGVGTVVTELSAKQIADLSQTRQALARVMSPMLRRAGFDEVAARFEGLRTATQALRGTMDAQAVAAIGLEMHESLASLIINDEFRLVWHQLYYKHARSAYRLLATEWPIYIQLQCDEIDAYIDVLRVGRASDVGLLYAHHIRIWADHALLSIGSRGDSL